jgi:hypothetical protein
MEENKKSKVILIAIKLMLVSPENMVDINSMNFLIRTLFVLLSLEQ